MRKPNKLYGLKMLCLGILLFFSQCETNEDILTLNQGFDRVERSTEKITFNELPGDLSHNIQDLHAITASGRDDSQELMMIDESSIVKVVNQTNQTKYSIKFSLPGQPTNVLYNLVVGINEKNQETEPFVIKYTIDNMEEVYANGTGDFSKMKGKISEYTMDSFQSYLDAISAKFGRSETDVEPDPCAEYSNSDDGEGDGQSDGNSGEDGSQGGSGTTGGGGYTDGNSGSSHGDTGSGGGEFENTDDTTSTGDDDEADCNILAWSNGETDEVFGISWSCSDGQSGSVTWGRSESEPDCPGNGDVGINDGEDGVFYWPSCESFNYYRVGGAFWQTAAVSGVRDLFFVANGECVGMEYGIMRQVLYFQLPINGNYNHNSGFTRTQSAASLHEAFQSFQLWYESNGCTASHAVMEERLLQYIKDEFEELGGNVTLTPPNGFAGRPTFYEESLLSYGDCY
ncbi:MAG: hypothetical protein R8G66_26960 [Cytophagales bacterium]|nr:hypothetical protein [Cytophagales bacterium]